MRKKIERLVPHSGMFMILILTVIFSGCNGGGSPSPAEVVSGAVVQGAVQGATVFADHLTGSEADRKLNQDESPTATTTDADGNYTLPVSPGYDYIIVSIGGTDSITGQPAMQMLAPAGARNVSPLTTMVTLNPSVQTVIESLGIAYDANLAEGVTPAALLLVQSIQATVVALTSALDPDDDKLTNDQCNAIQQTVIAAIADQIQNQDTAKLTTPVTLTTILQSAVKNALDDIVADPDNSNVTINTTSQSIANAIVNDNLINSVAGAISTTNTFSTAPEDVVREDAVISPTDAENINSASNQASNSGSTQVTVTITPGNRPPTISGTPATTVFVREDYKFTPVAADDDGNTLVFSIVNKPSWASFNTITGALTGRPGAADVGTTAGIVISVSDGIAKTVLQPFSLTVTAVTGSTGSSGGSF